MAKNDQFIIANPTPTAIESAKGKVKIEPGQTLIVTINDEANAEDLVQFICEGCTVAPASLSNVSFKATVTDKLDNATQLIEKGARQLESMARAVISAKGSTFAEKGL